MSLVQSVGQRWKQVATLLPGFVTDGLRYWPAVVVPALLGVVASAVFTRLFPPVSYGVVILVTAILSPLVTVLTQPVAQPVGRFFAEYRAQQELAIYRSTVSRLFGLTLAAALAVDATGFVVVERVGLAAPYTPWIWGGAMALVVSQSAVAVIQPMLSASFQIVVYRRIMMATAALAVVLPLMGIAFFGRDIAWLIWGPAVASAVFVPWMLKATGIGLQWWRTPISRSVTHPVLRRFLQFGLPMALWFLAFSLLTVGDRYVIQDVSGTAAVGIYGVSYSLAVQAVNLVTGPYLTGCWPRILQQWAGPDRQEVRKNLRDMTDIYLMIGIAVVGETAVVGHSLLGVLVGSTFSGGYRILVPVAAGSVVAGASTLGHKGMELLERNWLMAGDGLAAAIINIGLNVWAIPRWGWIAAGYTTLASYLVYMGLVWWQARRCVPWDLSIWRICGYIVKVVIAWSLGDWVVHHMVHDRLLAALIGTLVFVAAYVGMERLHRRYAARRSRSI